MKSGKLSEKQIIEIKDRVASGEKVAKLAKEFNVDGKTIYYHISKTGTKKTNALAQAKLEKENQILKLILAETMLELDKEKKLKLQNALKNI